MSGGFVWGVNWMNAYPGAFYQRDSPLAAEWALRLSRPMHEVRIEANVLDLTLVFHEIRAFLIGREDAATGELVAMEPVELVGGAT